MLNYFAHAALTRGGLFQFSPGLAIKNYTSHSTVEKMKSPSKATEQHKQGGLSTIIGHRAGLQRQGGRETEGRREGDRAPKEDRQEYKEREGGRNN
jgi:hypothetical protein